jgi:predicted aspartyl protease
MQLLLKDELPFTTISIAYQSAALEIPDVLIDTGSASTVLSVDLLADVQIFPTPEDILHTIHGVGGSEVVFTRKVDYLQVGEHSITDFEIEVGGMDYGFSINGILGMDFLTRAGAIINLKELKLEFAQP